MIHRFAMKTPFPPILFLLALALPMAVAAQPAYVDDRLNQLQQTITTLTGQVEQLQYANQQLQQQMEKMQTDYEFRIEQLEKGRGGGVRPPGPAAGPAPNPMASAAPPGPAAQPASAAGADQLYQDSMRLFGSGDYAGAERGFKTFLQRYPQHPLAGNAQFWIGESSYVRGDYQGAMTAYAEGYKVYKSSPKGPDNLMKLGITLAKLGRKSDACAVFARFGQDYPKAMDIQKKRVDFERQRDGC